MSMAVRKLGNSWWADFQFRGVRYRRRSPDNSKSGAATYEAILRGRLVRGEPVDVKLTPAAPTFQEFAKEWMETHVTTNNKSSTQRSTRMILEQHLVPTFGSRRLDAIAAEDIERYKASRLQAGLSPKTVNNHLGVLGKCLRTAAEWGRMGSVPRFRMLKVPPDRFDFLDPTEAVRLVAAFADALWKTMGLCALRSGLRLGELIGLRWEDIDLERRQLTVRRSIVRGVVASPKSNKVRHVPLADDLYAALVGLGRGTGYVFEQADGEPVTRGMAWRAIQTACKRAALRPVGWHVLRHSFASQLASEGVSMRVVQELLGHADLKMTMRYAHLAPSSLRDAVAVLQAAEEREGRKVGQRAVNDAAPGQPASV